MGLRPQTLPRADMAFIPFEGGYDNETPPWEVPPGYVRDAQNYEIGVHGGYQDVQGYERFDGRPKPSEQTYSILEVTITGTFSVDDTVTGAMSAATAKVLRVVDSGHADYSDTTYLVVSRVSGTFQVGENLEVSSVAQGTVAATARQGGARTSKLHAEYNSLAAGDFRGDIAAVPGEGDVWGVFRLGGSWYALRNKAGGATAGLYKENATTGWTEVTLGRELDFSAGGTAEVSEGDVLLGATSGATATVERIVLDSGTWAGGDAAGRFVLSGQTGTFQSESLHVQGGASNVATITGDSSAITIAPDGRLDYDKSDAFSGGSGQRLYGATGADRGFEFDGSVYAPIDTGMATDTPEHVIVHQHHVFFSFGSSVQHSGIGDPYSWSPVLGASELNVGDDVTSFHREPGEAGDGALSIFSANKIHILYGTSSADWNLEPYRPEVGAYEHTVQQVGQTVFLHERGLTGLRTVQAFGNFAHNTFSARIKTFLNARRGKAVASCIVRDKNQYRLFFNDQWALYVTTDDSKIMGIMPIKIGHTITSIASEEGGDSTEEIMFGASDGFVYQMEKGTSFDGAKIDAYLSLAFFYPRNSISWIKKWLMARLEVRGEGYAEFLFTYELDYAASATAQPGTSTKSVDFSPATWGSFVWDRFVWDSVALSPSRIKLSGESENLSLTIRKSSDYMEPIRFSGAMIRYMLRRQLR